MTSDRTDFLRDYYNLLTDDIRRSEATVFKACALEGAFVVLLVASLWGGGPRFLPPILVLLTSTWAMHLLINANLWARRSHLMAANVELEFFTIEDMDVLLPGSYYAEARRYRYRRIFRVSLILSGLFFLTGLVTLPIGRNPQTVGSLALAALLLCSLYVENRRCSQEYAYLVTHAPGRRRGTTEDGNSLCAP
jgi:hypothetical protein